MNRGPQNPILVPICRQGKHRSRMAIVLIGPNHEWSLVELSAVEPVSASPVELAPKIKDVAVPGALPINHAMQVGTCRGKVLHGMFVAQMAEVIGIDDVEHTLFAAANYQVRSGNQDSSRRVQVIVVLVQLKMISRCKPVDQMHPRVEFYKALAELSCAVPTSVPGDEIDVALVIDRGRLTGLPDARFLSAGRGVEDADLFQPSSLVAP